MRLELDDQINTLLDSFKEVLTQEKILSVLKKVIRDRKDVLSVLSRSLVKQTICLRGEVSSLREEVAIARSMITAHITNHEAQK